MNLEEDETYYYELDVTLRWLNQTFKPIRLLALGILFIMNKQVLWKMLLIG